MSVNPLRVVAKLMKAYQPLRRNDTDRRNESHYDMVTTYAPALKKFAMAGLMKETKGNAKNVQFLATHYLHYRNDEKNNNKFHYYALIQFELDGATKYVGANVYGRVGFGEKYQNLSRGFVNTQRDAENAINKHLYSKLNKGYQEIKLRRGSKIAGVEEYKVGDVYAGTWGYSMTLAKFAVITQIMPKSIKFQIVGNKTVSGDNFMPKVVPDMSVKKKVVMVRMPVGRRYLKVDDCYMEKWDGKPIEENHLD